MLDRNIAPQNIIKILKCGCKTNCGTNRCSCRRVMLTCGCSEENYENYKVSIEDVIDKENEKDIVEDKDS